MKFSGDWIRIVSKNSVLLNRVSGNPPKGADDAVKRNILLGMSETFATNWHFTGLSDALKNMVLLPEWYKQLALPQIVVEILVPADTKMYIGHAKEQKTTEENASIQSRNMGNKQRPAKKIYNVFEGGGGQVLIPRNEALTGQMQLSLTNIGNTYP